MVAGTMILSQLTLSSHLIYCTSVEQWLKSGTIFGNMSFTSCKRLTKDTINLIPSRIIKGPVGLKYRIFQKGFQGYKLTHLAGGHNKGDGEPVMIKHLSDESCSCILELIECPTSPSGHIKVRLNVTGGAGSRSDTRSRYRQR